MKVVDKYYKKEKNAKEGPDLQLCFESDVISLDIPVEGTTVCGGWKLEPLTKPRVSALIIDITLQNLFINNSPLTLTLNIIWKH